MDYSNKTIDALIEMKFSEIVEEPLNNISLMFPEIEKALE